MTQQELIVAQAEAFTILRDLMHMKADDLRPQRIINTIKQAAMAILRLKPLHPNAHAKKAHPEHVESGDRESAQRAGPVPHPEPQTRNPEPAPADPTAHLSDEKFAELLQYLPDSLDPATDKRRHRLARYNLPCTDQVKSAIRTRAQALAESLQQQRAA